MIELKGVIPAITTPFKDDQSLDQQGFRNLVDTVIGDGVHGIVVNGCTGESWSLNDEERAAVFQAAVEQTAGRVPVVAGCGAICARDAIGKVRQAEKAGCDAVMIQPPWYVLITLEEVFAYYSEILRSTELPVMIYNIPRRTGIHFSVDLVDRLADEFKVIALKESSKDWLVLSAMIRKVKDRINVFAGYANLLGLAALTEGAVGYVDSSTPVMGKWSVDFYHAATAGDLDKARRLQTEMAKLSAGFFGVGTFPAGIKVALDFLGRPGGRPRDPVKPLNGEQRNKIREVLISAGLLQSETAQSAVA
jgi:4-hydroxy-tetrahydrodipicolinate synthase